MTIYRNFRYNYDTLETNMWENYVMNHFLPKSTVSSNHLKLSTCITEFYIITYIYINMAEKRVSAGIFQNFLYYLNIIYH